MFTTGGRGEGKGRKERKEEGEREEGTKMKGRRGRRIGIHK